MVKKQFDLAAWSKRQCERLAKRDPQDDVIVDTFSVTRRQAKLIQKFERKEDKKFAKQQGRDDAYYGAAGGALTYIFTPTGLGTVLTVKHATGAILDVTDYETW